MMWQIIIIFPWLIAWPAEVGENSLMAWMPAYQLVTYPNNWEGMLDGLLELAKMRCLT